MKLNYFNQTSCAMTFFELLVVVVCVVILAVMTLALFTDPNPRYNRARRINCVSNLKQVDLSFRIWEGDNNNQFPMSVSVTNVGGMELMETGNLTACLRCLSNEISTTKILVCPADKDSTCATNWNDLDHLHVSYFFGADISNEDNPNLVLDGDDNLIADGKPVQSGMVELSTNSPVIWSEKRHVHVGNVGFADGSVVEEPTNGLEEAIQRTGLATNRIVIP